MRDLHRKLYNQGRTRWIVFLMGFAFLLWLWVKAGQTRHPGAIKQPWSVAASRILAVAGCILYGRIIFAPREQRVPVLYFNGSSENPQAVSEAIERMIYLKNRGYEDVPIDDIVAFIRDNRYVPKKAFGIVVRLDSLEHLKAILRMELPHITTLLPLKAIAVTSESIELPYSVIPGVVAENSSSITEDLKDIRDKGQMLFGKKVVCALISDVSKENIRSLALRSGYLCFFDGEGYNRFGDQAHLVRLIDVTNVIKSEKYKWNIYLSVQLFMGRFIIWPLTLISGFKKTIL